MADGDEININEFQRTSIAYAVYARASASRGEPKTSLQASINTSPTSDLVRLRMPTTMRRPRRSTLAERRLTKPLLPVMGVATTDAL